jgi:predicted acyltransferase
MSQTPSKRIATIDILRGITIFAMILCANIGYNSDLPGWMYHCQTPPPTYEFNPENPGITWVDLVFPFFLFTMGAAFPLAMRKRLDKGVSRWEVTGSLFRRWLTLTIFAIVLGNAYMTGRSTRPDWMVYVFNILLWGVMFMSLVRIKDEKKGKLVNNAGMFLLIVMAFVRTDFFGVPLSRWNSDIIIMILANIAIWGGLIWMFTKDSLRLRWLVILFISSIKAISSYAPEALSWVPQLGAIGWFFSWGFLQYLVIALAGSVVGDMLLSRRNETVNIDSCHIAAGIIAAAAMVIQLWGLYTRNVLADFIISAVLGAAFVALTIRRRNVMTDIGYIGFVLMLIGIALDPVDGGITKDHCNLSYLFATSGMTALTGAFILTLEFKWNIKWSALSGSGQNPMLAYTVTSFLTGPVLALCGILSWLDAISVGSPFWGVFRGLFITFLMVGVTCLFTKKQLFWRS